MISILYVDDEAGLLEILQQFLEQDGEFAVDTALSAQVALALPAIASYDAIVSDYQMPGMDGIAFLKEVRQRYGDMPFILFTGRGREEVVIDAINNGVDFYLQKGGDPKAQFAELKHKIRKAVTRRQAEILLSESEKRLSDIINFLPDATFAIDTAGTVMAWNRAMEAMSGITAAAMLGKGDYEYALPFYGTRRKLLIDLILEPDAVIARNYDHISRNKETLIAETVLPRLKGRTAILMGMASPLYNREGKITGAIESIRDVSDRVWLEEFLAKNRQQLEDAMDLAGLVNWEYDFNERMLIFDDRFFSLVGSSFEREGGNRIPAGVFSRQFLHPDDADAVSEEIRKAVTSTDPDYVSRREHRIVRRDGGIRNVLVLIRVMRDAEKRPVRVHGTIQDLTEQKRTEHALKESEERLQLALDGAGLGTWNWNVPTGELLFNERWVKMLGYQPGEIEPHIRSWERMVHPDDMPRVQKILTAHLEGKTDHYESEHRLIHKSGAWIWVLDKGRVIRRDADGRPLVATGTHLDITRRKLMETGIRESEEKFRSFVETSPDLIWEIDPDGYFRYMSPTVRTLMGFTPEEVIGRSIADLAAEMGKPVARQELARAVSAKDAIPAFEVQARHRDGRELVLEIRSARLTDQHGTLTGFRGVAVDITDRKKAERALSRANRQLQLLGSTTRHDILNKVSVIRGFLQITKMKFPDPKLLELLQKIESNTKVIQSLMEFTRVYQNLGTQQPQWIQLDTVMPRVQDPKTIALVTRIKGISFFADPMLEKVFYNLLDNSIRHGGNVTEIRVFPRYEDGNLVVVWEDNGAGIPASDKELIFEQGFGKHTGFGLFLIREILLLTDITIRETGEPGRGARFEILVPKGQYRIAPVV